MLGENCYSALMQEDGNDQYANARSTAGPMVTKTLANGSDWRIAEYICSAGPGDRAFEERHDTFSIAAVVEGSFKYRSETGTSLLHPGALLLGNHASCFECGHDHSTGDRCIALHVTPEVFAEVASSAAGSGQFTFPVGMLPASPTLNPWLVWLDVGRMTVGFAISQPLEADERVMRLLEVVISGTAGTRPSAVRVSARDERRLSAVIRHIEQDASEKMELERLSAMAEMSKYHFLRTFRRTVGLTPHQFVLGIRLRRAASCLLTTAAPISAIAFDAGFGDLSTFNARFRKQFGISPRVYRSREGLR